VFKQARGIIPHAIIATDPWGGLGTSPWPSGFPTKNQRITEQIDAPREKKNPKKAVY